MFRSSLSLMTRPNLRSNPQLAGVIPINEALEHKVLVLGVTSQELKAAVVDDAGSAYLTQVMHHLEFQRSLARAARLTLPEVSRLVLKTSRHAVEDVLKGISNSYPKAMELRFQAAVATVIPRETAERHAILLECLVGTTIHALYADGNGRQTLEFLLNRADIRTAIAVAAQVDEGLAGDFRCEPRRVPRDVIDREIKRLYAETRYEGFTQRDTRRYVQAVKREWATQAVSTPGRPKTEAPQSFSHTRQVLYDIAGSAFRQEASDVRIFYDWDRRAIQHELFLDGEWRRQAEIPLDFAVYQSMINLAKSDAGIPDLETHKTHDGDIHFKIPSQGKTLEFDGRICIFPYLKASARQVPLAMITIRILRKNEEIRGLGELGLLPFQRRMIEKYVQGSTGLLPVCGVMNSGKNGTLMSISAEIHRQFPGKSFISLEDPVETDIPFAFQTQVARHRGMQTSDYLPSILRSNVQVIQMGEINDADKAQFAIRAAQSGHYTQCTLHAKSPFDILPRLQMYGIPPEMVGEVLIGVIYQKLVPKLCDACAIDEDPAIVWNDQHYPHLRAVLEHWNVDIMRFRPRRATGIVDGKPCPHCSYQGRGRGYRGRMGLFEIWDAPFQRRQLQTQTSLGELRATALKLNHWTILRSALCYVQAGVIDLPTAMAVYNGIDPTYEGVPGYRFEDFEQYVRDLDTEVAAYKQAHPSQPAEPSSPSPSHASPINDSVIDAEVFETMEM